LFLGEWTAISVDSKLGKWKVCTYYIEQS